MKGSHILILAILLSIWGYLSYYVSQGIPSWMHTTAEDWTGVQIGWFTVSWIIYELAWGCVRLDVPRKWWWYLNVLGLCFQVYYLIYWICVKTGAWADKHIGV